jgi:hypothetical protein
MTTLYTNNFDAETVGALPSGWANIKGTWVVSTTGAVSSPNALRSGGSSDDIVLYTTTGTADGTVALSTKYAGNTAIPGILVRMDAAGANGYFAGYEPVSKNVTFFKKVANAYTILGAAVNVPGAPTYATGDVFFQELQFVGSTLDFRVWNVTQGETRPSTPSATKTDSTKTTTGFGGVRLGATNATQNGFDDFSIADTNAAAATNTTLSGPTSGATGAASSSFTVGANGPITGTVVVTPNDASAGGTFTPTTVSISSASPTATFTYTPATAGAKTIATTNNGGLTNPASITYTASAAGGATVAPNNAAIVYSPANWTGATGASNKSICAGAYFKTNFTGATCALNFDVSLLGSPASQIAYRIDGKSWTRVPVAATVVCTMPSDTAAAAYHTLEVVIKSTSETLTRWSASSATAVVFTGLTLDTGASVLAPLVYPRSVLFFGDSITEGVRTINQTATSDTDRNDALTGWAFDVGSRLGCEVGIIGFGSQGWLQNGSGAVPNFPSSYNLVMAGVSRVWPTNLAAVFVNMGTNDSGGSDANVTAAVTTFLSGILAATNASIVLMRPFNGSKATAIQAAVSADTSGRAYYVNTTGVFNTAFGADSINLHPNGPNNLSRIAPALLPLLSSFAIPRRFTVVVS